MKRLRVVGKPVLVFFCLAWSVTTLHAGEAKPAAPQTTASPAKAPAVVKKAPPAEKKKPSPRRDKINLPFEHDPQLLGAWETIDYVKTIEQFKPGKTVWKKRLPLPGESFLPDGMTLHTFRRWTRGVIINRTDKTAGRYEIRKLEKTEYLFFEWKDKDYTHHGKTPRYCVLRRLVTPWERLQNWHVELEETFASSGSDYLGDFLVDDGLVWKVEKDQAVLRGKSIRRHWRGNRLILYPDADRGPITEVRVRFQVGKAMEAGIITLYATLEGLRADNPLALQYHKWNRGGRYRVEQRQLRRKTSLRFGVQQMNQSLPETMSEMRIVVDRTNRLIAYYADSVLMSLNEFKGKIPPILEFGIEGRAQKAGQIVDILVDSLRIRYVDPTAEQKPNETDTSES